MNDLTDNALVDGHSLDGVQVKRLIAHQDERGKFTEIFSDAWNIGIQPAQWSVVESRANTFRGMHLHQRHNEYFLVVRGRACVGLYDLRSDSPTTGQWSLFEFSGAALTLVCFPPGLLHGWYFYDDAIHVQAVSETYESYRHDDNLGCRWDDPDLGIKWPFRAPLLSPEAAAFPSLRQLRQQLGAR